MKDYFLLDAIILDRGQIRTKDLPQIRIRIYTQKDHNSPLSIFLKAGMTVSVMEEAINWPSSLASGRSRPFEASCVAAMAAEIRKVPWVCTGETRGIPYQDIEQDMKYRVQIGLLKIKFSAVELSENLPYESALEEVDQCLLVEPILSR